MAYFHFCFEMEGTLMAQIDKILQKHNKSLDTNYNILQHLPWRLVIKGVTLRTGFLKISESFLDVKQLASLQAMGNLKMVNWYNRLHTGNKRLLVRLLTLLISWKLLSSRKSNLNWFMTADNNLVSYSIISKESRVAMIFSTVEFKILTSVGLKLKMLV